ncbi:MAG: zinc ribbon domain-containing protein [Acidobacteriota bacterium]|jgi:putative FmdB family regulatory protein
MPIYEYQCKKCGHRFELIQKFSDKPRKRCPECRGAVERLISPPAIRFKGTGWYVTDYADKKKGSEKAEDKPAAGESKPADKKSDDKKKKDKKAS